MISYEYRFNQEGLGIHFKKYTHVHHIAQWNMSVSLYYSVDKEINLYSL
jgi:hypothetical protein